MNELLDRVKKVSSQSPYASEDMLKKMSKLAEEASVISKNIESATKMLNEMSKRLREIEQHDMVQLMEEAGVDTFSAHGLKFTLALWVGGVWPKDEAKAREATEYLESVDAAGLLKTTVSANFGRDEYELAKRVFEVMSDACDPTMKSGVHPMTLRAWARRRLEEGTEINLPALGLIAGRHVKVKNA